MNRLIPREARSFYQPGVAAHLWHRNRNSFVSQLRGAEQRGSINHDEGRRYQQQPPIFYMRAPYRPTMHHLHQRF